jgi:plastocyanin
MKLIRIAVICLLFAFSLALAPVVAPTHAQAIASVVNIQNFAFSPPTITISAGTTVVWSNKDSTDHAPVSDTGAWDAGDVPGGTNSPGIVFSTPGTFPYHCAIHPDMLGTIVVTGSVSAPTATPTPPAPPTAIPTVVPTSTPVPTLGTTAVPATATPAPTATNTPLPLSVKVALGHKTVKVGAKQSIKVTSLPGAAVSITLTYPDGKKTRKSAHASTAGTYTWSFKQPSGHTTRTKHTVKVAVSASRGADSVKATKSYTVK